MNETVDNYCERLGSQFWAEPANAATNLAFIIAALLLLHSGPRTRADLFLSIWIGVIGIGSFLFHTFATRWAGAADTLPILVFILVYLYLALRHYLGLPLWAGIAITASFIPASVVLIWLLSPLAGSSAGYLPALFAILIVGYFTRGRDVQVSRQLLTTGVLFLISIGLRMADEPLCAAFPIGTHFMWHILNAVVLFRLAATHMAQRERAL